MPRTVEISDDLAERIEGHLEDDETIAEFFEEARLHLRTGGAVPTGGSVRPVYRARRPILPPGRAPTNNSFERGSEPVPSDREPATGIGRTVRELQVGWWLFALAVFAVIALVAWVYLAWIVFGLFVYYVARPIDRRVSRRVGSGNVSAAATLFAVVLPVVAVLGAAILVTLVEVSRFLTGDLLSFVEGFAPVAAGTLPDDPTVLVGSVLDTLREGTVQTVFSSVTRTVGSVAATLFNGFLSLLFAFFLLREDDRLAGWFRANVADETTDTHRYLVAVDEGLQSVYFGYTATIFIVVIMATVAYSAFNLIAPPGLAIPQPITLAVLTGLFTIVPLVGRSILYVVVTVYLVVTALRTDPSTLWFPLVFFAVMASRSTISSGCTSGRGCPDGCSRCR
ncbi:AI-2E family transporter [Halobaculum litoreum]|uniref:AI-2E family transporter n=1 Tax=Halobaculum litoreum TaxID=3031998 RepID=A0ABD5XTC0_9EURY